MPFSLLNSTLLDLNVSPLQRSASIPLANPEMKQFFTVTPDLKVMKRTPLPLPLPSPVSDRLSQLRVMSFAPITNPSPAQVVKVTGSTNATNFVSDSTKSPQ